MEEGWFSGQGSGRSSGGWGDATSVCMLQDAWEVGHSPKQGVCSFAEFVYGRFGGAFEFDQSHLGRSSLCPHSEGGTGHLLQVAPSHPKAEWHARMQRCQLSTTPLTHSFVSGLQRAVASWV